MPSARRLFGKSYPIDIPQELRSEQALLDHLGLGMRELKKIWWYRHRMYHEFSIAKGNGKVRLISAPDRRIKILQQKVALLLDRIYRRRNPVHGFVVDRSVKSNAEAHGSRRYVINIDLQDFFASITENRIKGLLQSVGVDGRVSEIVARLTCVHGCLPQGAPTSPVLSNMICYRLDTDLMQLAKGARAIYTRYADDMTFSCHQPPTPLFENAVPPAGKMTPEFLSPALRGAVVENGFKINSQKVHYADGNSRRIVTGVKINEGLNVDRRYIRSVRAMLHSIEKIGIGEANEIYTKKNGKGSIEAHLRGKIAYVRYLKGKADPVVRSLALRFNKCFPGRPINVLPTVGEMIDRSVWILEHDHELGQQGTAFFLKGVGLVTAAHCMENAENPVIYHRDSRANTHVVSILKSCRDRDLAILRHDVRETEYFELEPSDRDVQDGDTVTAYGYPDFGPGDRLNIREGKVNSRPFNGGVDRIETSQELSQGMSGGPVLDGEGRVLGVIHKGGPDRPRQLATHIKGLMRLHAE